MSKNSNGWIIDEKGTKSDERDLLVYNRDKAPQFLFDIGTGIFPLESIEYDIQVKNTISDKTLVWFGFKTAKQFAYFS